MQALRRIDAARKHGVHYRPTEREQREVAAVGAAVRLERRQGLWPRLSRFRREEADVEDASSRAQSARHRLRPAAGSCEPTYIAFSPRENMIDAARDGPRPQLRRVDACGRHVKPCRRGPPVSWSDLRLKPSSHAGLPRERRSSTRPVRTPRELQPAYPRCQRETRSPPAEPLRSRTASIVHVDCTRAHKRAPTAAGTEALHRLDSRF